MHLIMRTVLVATAALLGIQQVVFAEESANPQPTPSTKPTEQPKPEAQNPAQSSTSDESSIDKTVWGDFELVLKLEKTFYSEGEPIKVILIFRNTGKKPIKLDGILPERQSANSPELNVTTPDGWGLQTFDDGVPKNLMNEKPILVEPGKEVVLIDADLKLLSGGVHQPGKEHQEQGAFKDRFVKGKYQIIGRFEPTPQIYWSRTKPLSFEIK